MARENAGLMESEEEVQWGEGGAVHHIRMSFLVRQTSSRYLLTHA